MSESIHKPYMGNGLDRVKKVIQQSKKPSDIAEFYSNGATAPERAYIDWVLTKFPDRYSEEVLENIDFSKIRPVKDSHLEEGVK